MTKRPYWISESTSEDDLKLWSRVEEALGSELTATKLSWRESVSLWGVRSPGAMGWLLRLVREAWNNFDLTTHHDTDRDGDDGWSVSASLVHGHFYASRYCESEIEAMIVALEAAKNDQRKFL